MTYRMTKCSGVDRKIVSRKLKNRAEAEKFYQREITLDIFGCPQVEFCGEMDGFKHDEGITLQLNDWQVRKTPDGEDVNLLNGLEVIGLAKTYVSHLSDFTPILLLDDLHIEGKRARVHVTMDPQKAKCILIMESIYCDRRRRKPPKVPWRIRWDLNLLFSATRLTESRARYHYVRYYIYQYKYPYNDSEIEPIVTSYRNQLYEQYLEAAFMIAGKGTPPMAAENESS